MKKIPFLDLKRVNDMIGDEIHQAMERVINSGWYILGNECKDFEAKLVEDLVDKDQGYAVGCNSGTDALVLSLRAAGVSSGDEIITVSHTAIPTVSAIVATGAVPIFVDICKDTWVMDVNRIEEAITEKTKAIICVHLYGNMVNIFAVKDLLKTIKREDIIVIEDCAQAQGAMLREHQAGTIGDFGAFSFYPSKNIGALGDGGAVFTKNKMFYDKLLMYRNYGQKDRYNAFVEGGLNSRLDEMQASVLSVKLNYLHEWNTKKKNLMAVYREALEDMPVTFQQVTNECIPGWHLCVIAVENGLNREEVMGKLEEQGVQTLIHYPHPTHLQKAFAKYRKQELKITEDLAQRIISLPFAYVMSANEIQDVANIVKKCIGS